MFKNLMNGISLSALMLRDKDGEGNEVDPKVALREKLSKGNLTVTEPEIEPEVKEEIEEEKEEEEEEEKEVPENETDEQKKVREEKETQEKIEAKAKRKSDRMQSRIDKVTAEKAELQDTINKLNAQLAADPDKKLTAEEIEIKAKAIADQRLKDKEAETLQADFEKTCDALQKAARKEDKEFDIKINDIAEQFGPIPSFMIGVLDDLENGGEVLAHIANDDDLAEKIYSYKNKPAKMTKELVELSKELIEAKKPKVKKLSKVPEPVEPVKNNSVQSLNITEADTKNMDVYVAKRQRQMAEARKLKGF